MYEPINRQCDLCRSDIPLGEKYGVLIFNIESMEQNAQYPDGIVTVESSDEVNLMCMRCASKYNSLNVKQLLD